MKRFIPIYACIFLCLIFLLAAGCQAKPGNGKTMAGSIVDSNPTAKNQPDLTKQIMAKYNGLQPQQWGEKTSGVAYRLDTNENVLALTFDACGGTGTSNGYDAALIDYLDKMQIPATLFISGKWIDAHPDLFKQLAANDLFEIGNHGLNHRPCSINGKSVYNIKGTGDISEVMQEITGNDQKIRSMSGRTPRFYRSGTNYYDEVAVKIAADLGYQAVGYSVLGDAGATFNRAQVKKALLDARAGSIIICHLNHPEGDTAEGIMDAIPVLQQMGFKFVKLSAFPLVKYP
jgi:Predicted xylanase/chitin deacetylase